MLSLIALVVLCWAGITRRLSHSEGKRKRSSVSMEEEGLVETSSRGWKGGSMYVFGMSV